MAGAGFNTHWDVEHISYGILVMAGAGFNNHRDLEHDPWSYLLFCYYITQKKALAHIVTAYIVMAHGVMACAVMATTGTGL